MSKLGLIISREFNSRVRKKSFLILTILVPVLIVMVLFGTMWLTLKEDKPIKVLVADPGQWCGNALYKDSLVKSPATFYFYNDYIGTVQEFMEGERFQKYDALIMLNEKVPQNRRVPIVFRDHISTNANLFIKTKVSARLMEYFAIKKTNISLKQYQEIQQPFSWKEIDGNDPEGIDMSGEQSGLGFSFALLIYMFVFMYSMQVMRGVIEEKTNRVVEVIISSVKPFQLMMGKIIGIGLVGLTQFIIWLVLILLGLVTIRYFVFTDILTPENWNAQAMQEGLIQTQTESLSQSSAVADFIFTKVNWPLMIGSFLIYFIGGYLLYSAIFAAIGSMVDSETDTQQLVLPVTLPLIMGYVVSSMLITNPNAAIGTWFSIIPLTSPVVMMVKIAMNGVSIWEYILSITLLVSSFLILTWLAAKIYRTGILMYGKKASWKEVIKWIKHQ